MKKLLILLFICRAVICFSQVVPHNKLPSPSSPPRLVNDFAGMLSAAERESLEQKLVAYDDTTSNQVCVVTVHSLSGYEPDQFANELGQYWGVGGQAKFDNGVVILISDGKEENGRREVFIATGYGLEGALPAITCKQIVDYEMVPELKAGNYYAAINNGIDKIMLAAAGEYKAPDGYADRGDEGAPSFLIFLIILIVIFFIISRGGRGGGGMMSRRGSRNWNGPVWIGPTIFPGGGGGGGSSAGGGFGGFGGGCFGGGGVGGSW